MSHRLLLLCCTILMCTTARGEDAVLAAWADSTLGGAVEQHRASAATVVVVKGGEVVLERRYGYSDAKARTPVSSTDRFLIASVTKTITATAIARLLDQGVIRSLDDPANRYLKRIQLPRAFGRDVTIRQLLTHTAGFEERGLGVADHRNARAPASAAYIRSRLPEIVRPPGTNVVYANIDPPVLGLLIEDVSGVSYQQFVAREVLQPLGMQESEIKYTRDFTGTVKAYGYAADGGLKALPIDANAPFYAPTGSLHTTARDMGRFLLAQLGHVPGFLSPATLARMHTPLASNHPSVSGVGMAFFIDRWNGEPVVAHAGLFSDFTANLVMVPEKDLGMFVAWAGAPAPGVQGIDLNVVEDSFLAVELGRFENPARLSPAPSASEFAGRYWRERRAHTTPEVLLFLPAVITVAAHADNTLSIDGDGPYYAVSPGVYTKASDGSRAPRVYALTGNRVLMSADVARRVSGLGDPGNVTRALLTLTIVCATGLLAWTWQRNRGALFAALAGLGAVAVPLLIFGPSPSGLGLEGDILAGNQFRFTGMRIVAWIVPALGAILAAWLLRSRRWTAAGSWRQRASTMHLAMVALSALALVFVYSFLKFY